MAKNDQKDNLKSREIRVFISSTFKDMQAERDVLIKHIFPQLRKICEQRGVTFTEVDLRWGITDEQRAEGKVLPICFTEIRNCRPYFIGILGERYGWVPKTLPPEILEQEEWLQDLSGRSVTEMEIFHGVLNNPEMGEHAYFYFRDPDAVNNQPYDSAGGSEQLDQEDINKLAALKDRIRSSGFPVKENFKSPQELGEFVLADMQALIDTLFPRQEEFDPMVKETAIHEMYAAKLGRTYIRNQNYFDTLNRHAEGNGAPMVVLGESGSGKSALLANWVRTYQKEHPETFVLAHFIGASPFSSNWVNILQRILAELKKKFDIRETIPDKPDELRAAFAKWLNMAASKNRVVLVLDAVNQLEDRDGAPDLVWLPAVLPENIRLIVSTLPGRSLEEIQKRSWTKLEIGPLGVKEREQLIQDYLARYKKTLSSELTLKLVQSEKASNPLFLRAVLEELRVFGSHDDLKTRIEYYLKSKTILELFDKILERYEMDYDGENQGMVAETLSLLWASRHGLRESELLDLLGKDGLPLPRVDWTPFYLAAEQSLIDRGGFIGFGHNYFREAVYKRYIRSLRGQIHAHLRVAEYFGKTPSDLRSLEEYPWQLSEAQSWEKLYQFLKEPEYFKKSWTLNHYDVTAYWLKLEKYSELRIVQGYENILQAPQKYEDVLVEVSSLLTQTGSFSESQLLLEYILKSNERGNNSNLSETVYANLGYMAFIRGDFKKALSFHKTEEKLCREKDHLNGLQHALGAQGIILNANGDLSESMKYSKEQEKICRENGFTSGLQSSLGNQGKILSTRGELNSALKLFQEQEKASLSCGDISGLQSAYANQGSVNLLKENYNEALRLYKKAEDLTRNWLGDLNALQSSLGDQGLVLRAKKDPDGAMKLYKDQEEICKKLGDKIGLANSLGNQGLVMQDMGKRDNAMLMFKEQESICLQTGYKIGLQTSFGNQGLLFYTTGEVDKALALFEEQEKICRELGYKGGLQRCLDQKAQALLREKGNAQAALSIYDELEEMFNEEENLVGLQNIYARQANIKAQGNMRIEIMLHKKGDEIRRRLAEEGNPHFAAYKKQAVVIPADNIVKKTTSPAPKQTEFDLKKLENQAKSLMDKGDWAEALKIYKIKEDVCRKLQNKAELDATLTQEEKIYEADGNWEAILNIKKAQIQNAREMNHLSRLSTLLNNYAEILKGRGEINEVLQVYKEIEIVSRTNMANPGKMARFAELSQMGVTSAMLEQARIFLAIGDLDEAMRRFKEIEKQHRNVNDANGLNLVLGYQARILKKRGDYKGALALLQEAEPLKKRASISNPELMAQGIFRVIDYEQAELLYLLGEREQALALYDKQEAHCLKLKNEPELRLLYSRKAEAALTAGDLTEVMKINKQREKTCLDNNNQLGLLGTYGSMAAVYEVRGDYETALKLNKEQEKICRQINNAFNLHKAMGDQVRLLAKKGELTACLSAFEDFEDYCRSNGFAEEPYFVLSACEESFNQHAGPADLEKFKKKKSSLKAAVKISTGKEINPELIQLIRFSRQQLERKSENARKERDKAIQKGKTAPKLKNIDLENEYKLLENRARGLKPSANFAEMLQIYQRQEQLAVQSGDKLSLGNCYCNMGVLYKEKGVLHIEKADLEKAQNYLLSSEKIFREYAYQVGLQYVLENQGGILKSKNDLQGALRKFEEQEKICRSNKLDIKLRSALNEIGDIYKLLKDYDKAFEKFKEKYDLCKKSGGMNEKYKAYCDLAWIYEQRQDYDKALEAHAEWEKFGWAWGYLSEENLQAQGNLFFLKGDWQGAFNTYTKQYNSFYKYNAEDLGLQNVLSHQAMVRAMNGENKGAKDTYLEIGKIGSKSTHNNNPEDLSNFKALLSALEKQEEDSIASDMKSRQIVALINQAMIYYYGTKQRKKGLEILVKAEEMAKSDPQLQTLALRLIAIRVAVKTFFWKR